MRLLVVSIRDRCAGSLMVRERIDSAAHRFRSRPLHWVVRGERWGAKKALDKWKKRSIIEMFSGQPDDRYTKRTEQKPSEADFVRRGDTAE